MPEHRKSLLEARYLRKNEKGELIEDWRGLCSRVAYAVAKGGCCVKEGAVCKGEPPDETCPACPLVQEMTDWAEKYERLIFERRFIPNSPTLFNAGTGWGQYSGCYVIPVEDELSGIMDSVKLAAMVHQTGGGVGMDFTPLRPEGDQVGVNLGVASGPVTFMTIFNQTTEVIKQGGKRRGANMGIMRYDHPEIMRFIMSKKDKSKMNNFNLSVAVDDKFMRLVRDTPEHASYPLINPRTGEQWGIERLDAREVFHAIVKQAYEGGEPGIIFLDRINKDNPTPHLGQITATNPCGEQPLLPFESCNLGSMNLVEYVGRDSGFEGNFYGPFDWASFNKDIAIAIRFLDGVITINNYPHPKIEEITRGNRKVGLGVMGLADAMALLGIPYSRSIDGEDFAGTVAKELVKGAKAATRELGEEFGSFPNYEKSAIFELGVKVRNATVTTIAPTGSIGILAGVSGGIEPIFALGLVRKHAYKGGEFVEEIHEIFWEHAKWSNFWDYKEDEFRKLILEKGSVQNIDGVDPVTKAVFVTAHDLLPEEHVKMQEIFQRYIDNGVSKTVNLPSKATIADVKSVLMMAYNRGCKGITVYRDGCRDNQTLSTGKSNGGLKPGVRPFSISGETFRIPTGCGPMFITVNYTKDEILEVFASGAGKAGGCQASNMEGIGRVVSVSRRAGVDVDILIHQLQNIRCPKSQLIEGGVVTSCADAIAKAMNGVMDKIRGGNGGETTKENHISDIGICPFCPNCGLEMTATGGNCFTCSGCGEGGCL